MQTTNSYISLIYFPCQSLSAAPPDLFKSSRMMSDKISAVNQVAAVAKGNTVGFVFHFYCKENMA